MPSRLHPSLVVGMAVGVAAIMTAGGAFAGDGAPATATATPPASATAEAYQQALEHRLPAAPGQIRAYRHRLDATRSAIQRRISPKLVTRSLRMTTEPGGNVPVLSIATGYVATLTFVDATGAAWPITAASVGNPKWFSIDVPRTKAENQIVISALGTHRYSNLTVPLNGESMPLSIELHTNPKRSDAVVGVQLGRQGPNAPPSAVQTPEQIRVAQTPRVLADPYPGGVQEAIEHRRLTGNTGGRDLAREIFYEVMEDSKKRSAA